MSKLREKYENMISAVGEITGAVPYIELQGRSEMLLSGCGGILDYSSSKIVVNTFLGNVTLMGENLCVEIFRGDILAVKGKINMLCFGGEKYDN